MPNCLIRMPCGIDTKGHAKGDAVYVVQGLQTSVACSQHEATTQTYVRQAEDRLETARTGLEQRIRVGAHSHSPMDTDGRIA